MRELQLRSIAFASQRQVRIEYKGITFEEQLRCDLLLGDCLLLRLEQALARLHTEQS